MKKLLLSAFTLIASCFISNAQTGNFGANYTYQINSGTYTALTTPTVLSSGAAMDDAVFTVTLSSGFSFNGASTTTLIVTENGYLSVGTDPASYNPLSNTATGNLGIIAPFGRDLGGIDATSELSWAEVGNEAVFQWKNVKRYTSSAGEILNFQARLDKTTGVITFVYGTVSLASGSSTTYPQVGLRGAATGWAANLNNLMITNTTGNCSWQNATTGSANSSTMYFDFTNSAVAPASGLQYIWTPGTLTPPVRTIAAVSSIGTTSVVLNITQPAGTPTGYNVQYRAVNTCSWTNAVSNPFPAAATLSVTGLSAGTNYQYRIQSIYAAGTSIYSHVPAAFTTLATCPVPTALNTSTVTSSTANFTWTAGGTETAWDVYYGPQPLTAPTATTIPTVTTSINSYSATGLNPLAGYAVYVRANCGAGDMSVWTAVRNFTTAALATDLQTASLIAPAVSATGCYGSSIPVIIQLRNAGTSNLDFSTNNATVLTSITGTNPQSFTTTVNTGTLAANATLNVTVTSTYNMSAVGVYTINASSTLASPDANTANNAMAAVTRTSTAATPAPYVQDFAAGATPAGWVNTSSWSYAATHGLTNNGIYYNLYSTATTTVPSFNLLKLGTLTGAESITFDFRVLNYSTTYPGTQVPPTGNWGSVQVQVSTDCGATFATIGTIDNTTHTITSQAFTNKGYSLAGYAGQNVIIKILGTWVAGDYYVDMDNFNIASCFAPTSVTSSNVTQTGATIAWTAPSNGTPASYNYEIRTSGAAGSGTLGAVSTGSVAAPTTSVAISGLTAFTTYTVYVQSNCGGSDVSGWTPVSTFTTLANCQVPSGLSAVFTPTTAVATWTAGSTETSWDIYYGVSPLVVPTATTVATATTSSTTFTLTGITPSTGYAVYVRANCGSGNMSIWTPVYTFTTPCLPPNVLTTNGSTRCGTGTTTLTATADMGGTLQWYANPTGGAPLASGTTFTTPSISATTNYYVSAVGSLVSENVGRVSAASATGFLTTPNWGVVFNTTKNVLVNSATIYPIGTGSVTIALLDAAGTELASTSALAVTGTGTNSPVVVNLGFNVPTGNNFKIVLKSYTGITDLIRDGSGNVFPYNSTSGAVSVTGGWTGTASSTSYYWFYNLNVSSGCESARSMVTATVTAPPALTLSSSAAICAGSGIATLSVTSTLSDYDSYSWTPTTGLFTDAAATVPYTGTASTVYVKSINDGVLSYNVNANNSVSGCATIASASVAIKAAPTTISLTANPNPVCAGSTVSLSAVPNAVPVTVFTENFNGATNTWSTTNTSTGGTPANAAWTLRNSPYTSNVGTGMTSNDASQFYLADSDAQGSGGTANVTLQSPAINTNGLTALTLSFNHYYNYYIDDVSAKVEVSTNGTTWTSLQDYTTGAVDVGTPTAFNTATINLNSYVGNSTLYIRYNYSAVYGYGWAIDNVTLSGTTINDYSYAWTSTPAAFTASTSSTTDMPTANTTYSVVITNTATSCSNSSSVAVTVNALPVVTAATSNTTVCAGSTATLTAGGATNYTWTAAGTASTQVVTPTAASVYTVTGETAGCSNTATVSVGVNAVPVVTAISSQTLLCDDGSTGAAILTASTSASTYSWSDGATTMTTSVTPTTTTTYTVTVTELGCSADAFVTVTVSNCNGVKELIANGINVYPNPTNGILNISISSELAGNTSIEVYDAIGKLVIKETLSTETTTINTTKLTDGIYVFKVINNNQAIKIGKIVKQ